MSEKDKDILKRFSNVVPKLEKENQKYILGIAEGMVIAKESNGNIQVEEIMESK